MNNNKHSNIRLIHMRKLRQTNIADYKVLSPHHVRTRTVPTNIAAHNEYLIIKADSLYPKIIWRVHKFVNPYLPYAVSSSYRSNPTL
jgi:hypothetical protein